MEHPSPNQKGITPQRVGKIALLFVLLFATVTGVSSLAYTVALPLVKPYRSWDPYGCFLLISAHHIVQAALTLLLLCLLRSTRTATWADMGFHAGKASLGLKPTLLFCALWLFAQFGLSLWLKTTAGAEVGLAYPPTVTNLVGNGLFELLLSGTSEELLFRALPIALTIRALGPDLSANRAAQGVGIALATLIFTLAHIQFQWFPLQITHFSLPQILTCCISGSFFGYLFVKTKSVLAPMIAHNLLNAVITLTAALMTVAL